MAENPLLPHRKLQELYTLMGRARVLERRHRRALPGREAVLAAAMIQLQAGDLVSAPAEDRASLALAPPRKLKVAGAGEFTPAVPRLLLAAASARGLQYAGAGGMVCAMADAGTTEPRWREALSWAQTERLPFLLLAVDSGVSVTGRKAAGKADRLDWPEVQGYTRRLQLPVLTVDGDDAVAVFRCVQEATLRARSNGGPAVVWAVLTSGNGPQRSGQSPRARLERYLKAREIELPRTEL